MRDQLFSLKGQNLELDNVVNSTATKLRYQELEYARMKRENTSLGQIRKQGQELIALKNQLENELQTLKIYYASLKAKNEELNNTVALLQEKNRMLADDLDRAAFAAVDQSQIQAVRGKSEKPTVRARKTRKLITSFEVSANLKNLSFRIRDPKGNVLDQNSGTFSSTLTPSDRNLTVSNDDGLIGNKMQNVEMVYIPGKKLGTGIYTFEILNENLYVGSLKVKLN